MAKTCNVCGTVNVIQAGFCQQCGQQRFGSPTPETAPSRHPSMAPKAKTKIPPVAWCAVIALILVGWAVFFPDKKGQESKRERDAEFACKDDVTPQLKSPATASFDEATIRVSKLGSDDYRFFGTVDGQNDFGATVRLTWNCIATKVGDDYEAASVVTE